MPYGTLTRITSKPTHKQLQIIEKELAANLMAIPCPWGNRKGHLGLLQDPVLYFQRNGASYIAPATAPPDNPINPPAAAPARKAAQAANLAKCKAWNTYTIVCTITHDQFTAAINNVYYAEIDDPTKGLNAISLCDLVTHICSTYATISQPNVDNNLAEFVTGIKPSLPLAVYTRKQEKCQAFAQDACIPISKATIVTTGTKAALNCGGMEFAWHKWNCCPLVDHTWNNWKLHWTSAFAETRNISHMITNNSAFVNQNQAATEAEQAAMMAKSLDNLASAAIQKNDTVEKLVTANEKLAKALANANTAIAQLRLPNPPNPPSTSKQLSPITLVSCQARLGPYWLLFNKRL
jgi:hypothetical protein